jgi:tryptophan synthase alpha chain
MTLHELTQQLKHQNTKALVAFLTAGYPNEETFMDLVRAASAAGCDIIEIGIPFSDPIADGPLIQESSRQALGGGITLHRTMDLAKRLAQDMPTPLVFMTYYNPVLRMGSDRFARLTQACGVGGVILPDVPKEESEPIRTVLRERNLTYIDLIAPTSNERRITRICDDAKGFLYLVSVTGVTGVRAPESQVLGPFVERVRAHTDLPLYVGFGISDDVRAREVVAFSDGVIIGSALIRLIQSARSEKQAVANVGTFLRRVKDAIASP